MNVQQRETDNKKEKKNSSLVSSVFFITLHIVHAITYTLRVSQTTSQYMNTTH